MIFKILIVVTMFIFYGCYFIKQIKQKKRGIRTNQLGKNKKGFEKMIESLVMIFSISIVAFQVFSIIFTKNYLPYIIRWMGLIVGIIGDTFFILGVITMKDSWRAGVSHTDETQLITNGIYKISRNPAFLGFYLNYIGVLIVFFNIWLLVLTLITIVLFHLQIVFVEEKYLKETFKDDYLKYKKRTCRYFGILPKNKIKKVVVIITSLILVTIFFIFPLITVNIYEFCFGYRYETPSWLKYDVSEFPLLNMERSDFYAKNNRLAGYKYYKNQENIKGVVVLSHGLGGGGHNQYMPLIDYFTTSGYYCFTYDACGNDLSEGYSVKGLPEGVIDLDFAVNHLKEIKEYQGLPIYLVGHSYGVYATLNVLNFHREVSGVVIMAGFNESSDLLEYYGNRTIGKISKVLMPYFRLYERIKFGSCYTDISGISGLKNSNSEVIIVHSLDDETVPMECGYTKIFEKFKDSDNYHFSNYNRGHSYLFYSDESATYREELNLLYKNYVEGNNLKYNNETKTKFMNEYLDKSKCFEIDEDFFNEVLSYFEKNK